MLFHFARSASFRLFPRSFHVSPVASNSPGGGIAADQQNQSIAPSVHSDIPFAKARGGPFVQESPYLENSFEGDGFMKRSLQRILPDEVYQSVRKELSDFGARTGTDIYRMGRQCELNQPSLQIQDAWANPNNVVVTCESWKRLKDEMAKEGLVSLAYERSPAHQGYSRLVQMAKNFLFYPSSGLASCPLAMTDGAAKTLEANGLLKEMGDVFGHLTSRDPGMFWTSGQWMTEKRGGSDVAGGTETVAVKGPDGRYRLYGYKFFSSATDANVALTLARIVDPDTGRTTQGTKGLSLFVTEVDQPNRLQVMRLKQKLGTKQLPTGELLLDGMEARLASPSGRGVACISPMLSITRLHNAAASVSSMRRIISLARDYSKRRVAFGRPIAQHPLHVRTMARMELECRAGWALFVESARLLSLEESGASVPEEDRLLLRILLPLLKLYTGKQCVGTISEGLECFGGQGYMEDTGLPGILRDAQVTPIWEGTTNILSLDVLRALGKSQGRVLEAFSGRIQKVLDSSHSSKGRLDESFERLKESRASLFSFVTKASADPAKLEYFARDFAFGLARSLAGALLLEHAVWSGASESDVAAASRWLAQKDLLPDSIITAQSSVDHSGLAKMDEALVFDDYSTKNLLSQLF